MDIRVTQETKFFSPEAAEAMAKEMNNDDPDWEYKVVHCPKGTGYSFIEIYDEDGERLGKL